MSEMPVVMHVPASKAGMPEGPYVDSGLAGWGRPELTRALLDGGATPLFTRGVTAYDFTEGTAHILRPDVQKTDEGYTVMVRHDALAVDAIRAIRNTTKPLEHGLPEVNDPAVRAIAKDKVRTHQLLDTIGLGRPYAAIEGTDITDIHGAFDAIDGDTVVLKPRTGLRGKGICIGSKVEIAAAAAAGDIDLTEGNWLVEAPLDIRAPFGIKGRDAKQRAILDRADELGLPRELRIHCFGRAKDGEVRMSPIMRVADDGESNLGNDDWVYVDPDTIPAVVWVNTARVYEGFSNETDVKQMHLGVDWVLSGGMWQPMEVNASEPQLVFEKDDPGVAREHASSMASLLVDVARTRSVR